MGEASRQEVIARLPHVATLNGGDVITESEREDAERALIRRFLDSPPEERPGRVEELVLKHGQLQPLAKVDLTPTVFVRVVVAYGEERRELVISVRQRVRHFRRRLQREFAIPGAGWQLWYYDQELSRATGPEEVSRYPEKGLHTLGLREGDCFVIDRRGGQGQG